MRRVVACVFVSSMAAATFLVVAPTQAIAASANVEAGQHGEKPKLTKAERAHVRQIVRNGKAEGLTKEQIKAKVDAYLKSIGKERRKHPAK